ncbi:hypothetical protein PBI_SCTP2_150 [Salicola phage SCTP-2]|nr:hypothetical protein PBI_SCTP2_150 [Salicola phage SCTP-2]
MNNNYSQKIINNVKNEYNIVYNKKDNFNDYLKKNINKNKISSEEENFSSGPYIFKPLTKIKDPKYYDFINTRDKTEIYTITRKILTQICSEIRKDNYDHKSYICDMYRSYDYIAFQNVLENYLVLPSFMTHIAPIAWRIRDEFHQYCLEKFNTELTKAGLYDIFYSKDSTLGRGNHLLENFMFKTQTIFYAYNSSNYYKLMHYFFILRIIDNNYSDISSDNFSQYMIPVLSYIIFLNKKFGMNEQPYVYMYNHNTIFTLFDSNIDMSNNDVDDFDMINNHCLTLLLCNRINNDTKTCKDNYVELIKNSDSIQQIINTNSTTENLTLQNCEDLNEIFKFSGINVNTMNKFMNEIFHSVNNDEKDLNRFIKGKTIEEFKHSLIYFINNYCYLINFKKLEPLMEENISNTLSNIKNYAQYYSSNLNNVFEKAHEKELNPNRIYFCSKTFDCSQQLFFGNITSYFNISPCVLYNKARDEYEEGLIEDMREFIYGVQ